MAQSDNPGMADSRALITDTERERLSSGSDAEDSKKYQAASRVRTRIEDGLAEDIEFLETHRPDLAESLRDTVSQNARPDKRHIKNTINRWQLTSGTPDEESATLWLASEGAPGLLESAIVSKEDVHPGVFQLSVLNLIESIVDNKEYSKFQAYVSLRTGLYVGSTPEQIYSDFGRDDVEEY